MKKILLSILFVSAGLLHGHNNYFIPGDAYFSSALIEDIEIKGNELNLGYMRYSPTTMMCGYFGYSNIRIYNIPDATIKNLKEILSRLDRKMIYQPMVLNRKGNSIKFLPLFVYNKDFDIEKYNLRLPYNENWSKIQIESGRDHAVYDNYKDQNIILEDWSGSSSVDGLSVDKDLPSIKGFMGVKAPIEINGENVKFMMLVKGEVQGLAKRDIWCSFIVVDSEIKHYSYEEEYGKNKLVEKNENEFLRDPFSPSSPPPPQN